MSCRSEVGRHRNFCTVVAHLLPVNETGTVEAELFIESLQREMQRRCQRMHPHRMCQSAARKRNHLCRESI